MTDPAVLLQRLLLDETKVAFAQDDPYLRSYPEFVRYFQNVPRVQVHNVIIGASFVYSWMPTILKFKTAQFEAAATCLERARQGDVSEGDLRCVLALVNNSLVGTSKLLHFVNPRVFAIWDSRVCRYLTGAAWHYKVEEVPRFVAYQTLLRDTVSNNRFDAAHDSICRKVGYEVSRLRAGELIMFMNGQKVRDPKVLQA